MGDHGQGFPVGEPVQGDLAVKGAGPPGVDILGPVGEDQQHLGSGDVFQEVFQNIFGTPVDPVEVFHGQDQRLDLGPLEHDAGQGLKSLVSLAFGA